MRAIAKFFGISESELADESSGGVFLTLLMLPFRLIWGFIYFMIFSWTTSRSGRAFVFALPAMISLVGYIALVWVIGFKGDSKALGVSRGFYRLHIDERSPLYDLDAAQKLSLKAVEEAPENRSAKYDQGVAFQKSDRLIDAVNVMKFISPMVDKTSPAAADGYPDGHMWLAGYYATDEDLDLDEQERDVLTRKHYELATVADPDHILARLGLAFKDLEEVDSLQEELDALPDGSADVRRLETEISNKRDQAEKQILRAMTVGMPGDSQLFARQLFAIVPLLQSQLDRGAETQARIDGAKFINRYIQLARQNPDFIPLWMSIVKTSIMIGEFEKGDEYILEAVQLAKAPEIRQVLANLAAELDIERSKTFSDMDDEDQFLSRLLALGDAIKLNVREPAGYKELLYYLDGFDNDAPQDLWLRDSIFGVDVDAKSSERMDPRLPGVLHVVIGFRELLNDNLQNAKIHWETANQQFNLASVASNNLFQVYCKERDYTLEQKIELITKAIELFPRQANSYYTRATFHMEGEDYAKAIEDLEYVKPRINADVPMLEKMVLCYEKLGREDERLATNDELLVLRAKLATRNSLSTGFASQEFEFNENDDADNTDAETQEN